MKSRAAAKVFLFSCQLQKVVNQFFLLLGDNDALSNKNINHFGALSQKLNDCYRLLLLKWEIIKILHSHWLLSWTNQKPVYKVCKSYAPLVKRHLDSDWLISC